MANPLDSLARATSVVNNTFSTAANALGTTSQAAAANLPLVRQNVEQDSPLRRQFAFETQNTLTYPQGLTVRGEQDNGAYMLFSAFRYQRGIQQKVDLGNRAFSIALPMPGNLAQAYGAQWQQFDAGMAGAAVAATGKTSADMSVDITDRLSSAAAQITVGASAGFVAAKLQEALNKAADPSVQNLTSAIAGLALNPRREMAFNGMNIRTHGFSFQMTPRNREEAIICELIIKNFRNAQHTSFVGPNRILQEYPLEFVIEFFAPDGSKLRMPGTIPDSYLVNFQYTVNPGITTARFHSDNTPVGYSMSLSFTESVALSREDLILIDEGRQIQDGAV